MNDTRSVQFHLTNYYKKYANFVAHFTTDSDPEFTVMPKKGELVPFGSSHKTVFQISFTPIAYGKERVGKLVIQTKEMMWSYIIKGHFPNYGIPQVACKIENKWHTGMRMKLKSLKSER